MAAAVPPPNLSARFFYGLRTDIQYNAHYVNESDIIYPAGGVIVVYNHLQKKQKFIKLQDKHKPIKSLVLAPNRRWLALNEIAEEGQKPIITIYDMTTCKRRKILTVPFENSTAREFACVQFTFDSKYLVAVTGEPDWYLYYYNWDKGKVESHAKAQNPSGQGTVESVLCNPADATLVVITGPYTFRIMNVSETVWRQWGWCKAENINITSSMWLTPDRIMFGTNNGIIMMVENGELRQNCVFHALDVIEMSLKKVEAEAADEASGDKASTSSKEQSKSESEQSLGTDKESYPVTNFMNFPKGH